MQIDKTEFGSITIDGKAYDHDVIIHLSGEVEKRRKKLSKRSMEPRTSYLKPKPNTFSKMGAMC